MFMEYLSNLWAIKKNELDVHRDLKRLINPYG